MQKHLLIKVSLFAVAIEIFSISLVNADEECSCLCLGLSAKDKSVCQTLSNFENKLNYVTDVVEKRTHYIKELDKVKTVMVTQKNLSERLTMQEEILSSQNKQSLQVPELKIQIQGMKLENEALHLKVESLEEKLSIVTSMVEHLNAGALVGMEFKNLNMSMDNKHLGKLYDEVKVINENEARKLNNHLDHVTIKQFTDLKRIKSQLPTVEEGIIKAEMESFVRSVKNKTDSLLTVHKGLEKRSVQSEGSLNLVELNKNFTFIKLAIATLYKAQNSTKYAIEDLNYQYNQTLNLTENLKHSIENQAHNISHEFRKLRTAVRQGNESLNLFKNATNNHINNLEARLNESVSLTDSLKNCMDDQAQNKDHEFGKLRSAVRQGNESLILFKNDTSTYIEDLKDRIHKSENLTEHLKYHMDKQEQNIDAELRRLRSAVRRLGNESQSSFKNATIEHIEDLEDRIKQSVNSTEYLKHRMDDQAHNISHEFRKLRAAVRQGNESFISFRNATNKYIEDVDDRLNQSVNLTENLKYRMDSHEHNTNHEFRKLRSAVRQGKESLILFKNETNKEMNNVEDQLNQSIARMENLTLEASERELYFSLQISEFLSDLSEEKNKLSSLKEFLSYIYFKEQPSNIEVDPGNSTILTCKVSEDIDECVWLKDGVEVANTSTKYKFRRVPLGGDCSIHITNTQIEDDGMWQCGVKLSTNMKSVITSQEVKLTVREPPSSPVILNTEGAILENVPAKVGCITRRGNPPPKLEWFLEGKNITSMSKQSNKLENGMPWTWKSLSVLKYVFHKDDKDKILKCVANHVSYKNNTKEFSIVLKI